MRFTPLVFLCGLLLAGWLVSFALSRVASRFVFRPHVVEAMAKA